MGLAPRKRKRMTGAEPETPEAAEGTTSLSSALQNGEVKLSTDEQMLEARHLFVARLHSIPEIARRLDLSTHHLERWATLSGWHRLRQERERQLYRKMGVNLESVAKTVGLRTDELAVNIEGALERSLTDKQANGEPLTAYELNTYANALQKVQDIRRIVHGVEGKVDKKVVEIQSPALMDSIASAVASLPAKAKERSDGVEVRFLEATDVEYEGGNDAEE